MRLLRRHTVGILGGIESSARIREVAEDVLQRVGCDLDVHRLTRQLSRLDIGQHELGLVVEHLLEVRHPPLAVDGVAMESPADMIPHAAERHGSQRRKDDIARDIVTGAPMLPEQEQQLARAWKLRGVTEPASSHIERRREFLRGRIEHTGDRDRAVPGMASKRPDTLDDGGGGLEDWPRSSRQTRAISSRISVKPGRPHRDVGGK